MHEAPVLPREIPSEVDVIVVGAGLAGLSCARELRRSGASVVVLEARDRVGGRTLSQRVGNATFDLGGQWLGPGQPRVAALAAELGIETFPTYETGRKFHEQRDRLVSYTGTIPSMPVWSLVDLERAIRTLDWFARKIDVDDPLRSRGGRDWDTRTLEDWLRRSMLSARAREVFTAAIRVIFGAEPREVSMLYALFYIRAAGGLMPLVEIKNGAQQDRFVQGAQELSIRMARDLGDRVVLGAPVQRIVHEPERVSVQTGGRTFRGRYAVIALPPALAGRIEYDPLLPVARDQLTQRFPMGATVKCLALYDNAFWRDCGLSGEVVCPSGPVSVVFDNGSHDGRQPALLAFIVGQSAREWNTRMPAERRDAVLDVFARAFGDQARRPMHYVEQDWSTEEWTRGCPVGIVGPGALSACGIGALRAPVGRIHWAGTETATVWAGYMEGAIESATRVAKELAVRL